jgi:glycosyltransferase involved in cell wall biosynthesis
MSPPSRGLRILMTTDAVGGVWVFATALARELCRRGDHVTLVTMGPPPKEHQRQGVADLDGFELEVTDLALEWMDPEGNDRSRALRTLRAIERRCRPDLVHLNSYREACGAWAAPVMVTAHSCVRSWWQACLGGEPEEERWCNYAAEVAAGLVGADVWAAPTVAFRDTIDELYAPPTPGYTIHNGIDPGSYPVVDKEPFVLAAGRMWDEAKNLSTLMVIAADLDCPLRVAGSLRGFDSAAGLGHAAHAELLGELSHAELLAHMQRAAIFVAPSLYEPFGLTVLEAAAARCALVLSDIPTFRELWDGAGCFVDPRDPAAIGDAIRRIRGDASERARLQEAAARRARRYASSRMVDAYRATYAAMANATSVPGGTQPQAVEIAA